MIASLRGVGGGSCCRGDDSFWELEDEFHPIDEVHLVLFMGCELNLIRLMNFILFFFSGRAELERPYQVHFSFLL